LQKYPKLTLLVESKTGSSLNLLVLNLNENFGHIAFYSVIVLKPNFISVEGYIILFMAVITKRMRKE
jgi:hypothetical protein